MWDRAGRRCTNWAVTPYSLQIWEILCNCVFTINETRPVTSVWWIDLLLLRNLILEKGLAVVSRTLFCSFLQKIETHLNHSINEKFPLKCPLRIEFFCNSSFPAKSWQDIEQNKFKKVYLQWGLNLWPCQVSSVGWECKHKKWALQF